MLGRDNVDLAVDEGDFDDGAIEVIALNVATPGVATLVSSPVVYSESLPSPSCSKEIIPSSTDQAVTT